MAVGTIAWSACDRAPGPMPVATPSNEPRLVPQHGSVVRIDPSTGRVLAVIPVGDDPLLMEVTSGHVWTLNLGDGSRTRIDPSTNLAVTMGMSDGGAVGTKIGVRPDPFPFLSDGRCIWMIQHTRASGRLPRIDTRTGLAVDASTGSPPIGLATGDRSLWVGDVDEEAVRRIDRRTGETIATIPIGEDPRGIAFAEGLVWVSTETGVTAIDATTSRAVRTVDLINGVPDEGPTAIEYADGSVWVSIE
jgi:DNA-binding beta-propeller fold protein YncE